MEKEWIKLAWQEFQLLQQIIDRQMNIRWRIRGWLLGLQTALAVALYTERLDSSIFLSIALFATAVAWFLEMSENFVTSECIKRQTLIEDSINSQYPKDNPPQGFSVLGTSSVLKKTSELLPSLKYIGYSLLKPRRLFILLIFVLLPLLIEYGF
ncbi:MAG: hypothetical protein ABFS18_02070 [Thermodesulfobacteriota bacterium]